MIDIKNIIYNKKEILYIKKSDYNKFKTYTIEVTFKDRGVDIIHFDSNKEERDFEFNRILNSICD